MGMEVSTGLEVTRQGAITGFDDEVPVFCPEKWRTSEIPGRHLPEMMMERMNRRVKKEGMLLNWNLGEAGRYHGSVMKLRVPI